MHPSNRDFDRKKKRASFILLALGAAGDPIAVRLWRPSWERGLPPGPGLSTGPWALQDSSIAVGSEVAPRPRVSSHAGIACYN